MALPMTMRTVIGHEWLLYQYYVLNDESFDGCDSIEQAQAGVSDTLAKGTASDNLRLQEELCDLPLGAGRQLGRAFAVTRKALQESTAEQEMRYFAIPDAKADFLVVVASSRGVEPKEVRERVRVLALGAIATEVGVKNSLSEIADLYAYTSIRAHAREPGRLFADLFQLVNPYIRRLAMPVGPMQWRDAEGRPM